jgi:hypothetical protein
VSNLMRQWAVDLVCYNWPAIGCVEHSQVAAAVGATRFLGFYE